jgi:outer membrane receptor protein involved in Fe transport
MRGSKVRLERAALALTTLACTLVSIPSHAQDAAATGGADATSTTGSELSEVLTEIVVTGSRVRRAGFEAPTPTTVMGADMLEKLGTTNISSALNQMPAFQADQNASTNPLGSNAGRRYANLRNLGSQRTLVLMDGRRLPPSALTGQTDLNSVPQLLIERVDVVTGGSSAQWGSDAVSGVVNIVTRDSMDGFDIDLSHGESDYGDNKENHVGIAFGNSFAEGRGRLVVGGEWVDNDGVRDIYSRDWGREEWGFVNNAGYATNGLPRILVLPNVRRNQLADGGLIISGPLAGTTFGPGGTPETFVYGSPSGAGTQSGGDGYAEGDGQGTPLSVPLTRSAAQLRVGFDLTPGTEIFALANYSRLEVNTNGPGPIDYSGTGLVIRSGNPFIPAATQQQMDTLGLASFSMGRYWKDNVSGDSYRLSRPAIENTNTTQSYTLGINSTLGANWTWDAYAQYGTSEQDYVGADYRLQARFYEAVDAVRDGNGNIVCRSTLTNPTNGCVPVNLFGRDSVTPEAFDYFTGTQHTVTNFDRTVGAVNLHGTPFSTWAGPVSLATGLEYRKDDASMKQLDPRALARQYNYGNAQPISGEVTVREGYLESVVPLLANQPWAKALEFDGAVRFTDYSTSGNVTTWKAGLVYTIDDNLRLRASVSRDIRAANVSELFTSTSSGSSNLINPVTGGNLTATTISSGNPLLEPERARTTTFGIVLTPQFAPSLKLSADYYSIDMTDVISAVSAQTVVNFCNGGAASFCSLITYTTPETATVRLPLLNLAGLEVRGVDMEGAYGLPLDTVWDSLAGRMDFNLFATYQPTMRVDNGTSVINRAGDMGTAATPYGGPKWKWNALATYSYNDFSTTLGVRYVGEGKKDVTYTARDISDNTVDSVFYVSWSLGYKLPTFKSGLDLQMYANVQNLLNEDPPIDPTASSGNPVNAVFHDVIGRTYNLGFRAKW